MAGIGMREYRDIIGGGFLLVLGSSAAIHAVTSLRLGTVWQMGPGMFPAAVGVVIALLGTVILIGGLRSSGPRIEVDHRSMLFISLSVIAFAALIRPFGFVPAIVAVVAISSRSDARLSLAGIVLLAGSLSMIGFLIFQVGLNIPLSAFNWPR
ncbi:tripartite tricarboxylate transporter TctB family protein [Chelativorans sp. SCAU2101]|jgi:hypothetical protein|uniref:Tripartite tricarboxylate transporter TctB family protein n=1 Tax=Chelativorans petroleitrophicus TaxID=2975484 RepID=A0A9X2X5S3_9HYPH|nr:tripartite tricarboxylate transporter TctB family protein [Chelativorans petroleitrophicus]MCT8989053.1 tripartite tricarboxylate transporter TctB family protein [Chelativorans petroleitrophicus]